MSVFDKIHSFKVDTGTDTRDECKSDSKIYIACLAQAPVVSFSKILLVLVSAWAIPIVSFAQHNTTHHKHHARELVDIIIVYLVFVIGQCKVFSDFCDQ